MLEMCIVWETLDERVVSIENHWAAFDDIYDLFISPTALTPVNAPYSVLEPIIKLHDDASARLRRPPAGEHLNRHLSNGLSSSSSSHNHRHRHHRHALSHPCSCRLVDIFTQASRRVSFGMERANLPRFLEAYPHHQQTVADVHAESLQIARRLQAAEAAAAAAAAAEASAGGGGTTGSGRGDGRTHTRSTHSRSGRSRDRSTNSSEASSSAIGSAGA